MISDYALRAGFVKRNLLEKLGRHIWQHEFWIRPEAKTSVIPRIPQQYTTGRAFFAQYAKGMAHELGPYTMTLMPRINR